MREERTLQLVLSCDEFERILCLVEDYPGETNEARIPALADWDLDGGQR